MADEFNPATTDARVWAKEWARVARIIVTEYSGGVDEVIDEAWMVTWFANAIEAGRDAGARGGRNV